MTIKGWKAALVVELAMIGAYTVAKEVKDAYYKHKLMKCSEGLTEVAEKLAALNGNTDKEEEVQ